MGEFLKTSNQRKFATIINNLEKRNMLGYACETKEEACELALKLLKEDAEKRGVAVPVVGTGGSATLNECGLHEILNKMGEEGKIEYLFAGSPIGDVIDYRRKTLLSDTYFMSTNAITLDGELVNIDGLGNRVAALAFGPRQVILIVGYNKIESDLESAYKRVKNVAAAANAVRFAYDTPCGLTGKCADCKIPGKTLCCAETVVRFGFIKDRIKVILVNEEMGF